MDVLRKVLFYQDPAFLVDTEQSTVCTVKTKAAVCPTALPLIVKSRVGRKTTQLQVKQQIWPWYSCLNCSRLFFSLIDSFLICSLCLAHTSGAASNKQPVSKVEAFWVENCKMVSKISAGAWPGERAIDFSECVPRALALIPFAIKCWEVLSTWPPESLFPHYPVVSGISAVSTAVPVPNAIVLGLRTCNSQHRVRVVRQDQIVLHISTIIIITKLNHLKISIVKNYGQSCRLKKTSRAEQALMIKGTRNRREHMVEITNKLINSHH